MIFLLNTSGPLCKLSFIDSNWRFDDEWQSDRNLAKGLLKYIGDKLAENKRNWSDISAIGVFEGPGSFTGLRIGLAVLNTIADAQQIPIVGGRGEAWQDEVINKLNSGKDEQVVLPLYGTEANVTKPRK